MKLFQIGESIDGKLVRIAMSGHGQILNVLAYPLRDSASIGSSRVWTSRYAFKTRSTNSFTTTLQYSC